MPITGQALHLQAQLDSAVDRIVDGQTRDLVAAWALGWDEVAGDLNATIEEILSQQQAGVMVPASWFARSERLAAVLGLIGHKLTDLAASSGVRIVRDLSTVARAAAEAQAPIVAAMLPSGHQLGGIPSHPALDAIVTRVTRQVTARHRPLSADAYDAVRRELVRGVAVGINPRHTAQLMVDRAESGFNGGLTRALTISRTEVLDAHREAAAVGQQAHADVLLGWTWLTHLTPTTCRSCIAQNGTVHPLDEPGPLDHQCGRCGRMPTTKSWAELGIDITESPDVGVPDARAFFTGLTKAQQRKILGRDGYDAWLRGDFPMADWTRRRTTDGWRDSFVPATPQHRGGSGQGPGAGAPPAAGAGDRPSLADMLIGPNAAPEQQAWVEAAWRSEMDRTFGGFTAKADSFDHRTDSLYITGHIEDSRGSEIGVYHREIARDATGATYADHHFLVLLEQHQGTGFAEGFNSRLIDWYTASGLDRVEVVANIDVGGYTWASAGFDFADYFGAMDTIMRLMAEPVGPDEDADSVRDVLDRAGRFAFGTDGFPSAREFSQAGRVPGMVGRDASWPGKRAMIGLNKSWNGVLWL